MKTREKIRRRLCVALHTSNIAETIALIDTLAPYVGTFKIGLRVKEQPFYHEVVAYIKERKRRVFVDGKFHDVPSEVAAAVAQLRKMGVDMFTVHAIDPEGIQMMKTAVAEKGHMQALAVTVLTSVRKEKDIGAPVHTKVQYAALDALNSGMDGVICSARDLRLIRNLENYRRKRRKKSRLLKCTPGIRFSNSPQDDQQRIMTPSEAIREGSDMLVLGRILTDQRYNRGCVETTAKRIYTEVETALERKEVSS